MNPETSNPAPRGVCTQCHEGTYQNMTKDYTVHLRDGDQCTIANLAQRKCNQCGHVVLPWPSALRVDRAVADHTEPVTPEFLKTTRGQLQSNMTLLAESLGLGSKTWMRWENGEQNISRSMGYFIRTLSQFPEVYEWVADRSWRQDGAEEQTTTQEHSCATDELFSKAMQVYLSVKSREALSEDEKEESGSLVNELLNRASSVSKKSSINLRRGDIQDSDSRFKDSDSIFKDLESIFKDFPEAS